MFLARSGEEGQKMGFSQRERILTRLGRDS
jgi:hypothetical protein